MDPHRLLRRGTDDRAAGLLELVGLSKRCGDVVALDGCTIAVRPGAPSDCLVPTARERPRRCDVSSDWSSPIEARCAGTARPWIEKPGSAFATCRRSVACTPTCAFGRSSSTSRSCPALTARRPQLGVERWLSRLGLLERADSRLDTLSHGNQQRAQLAAALVHLRLAAGVCSGALLRSGGRPRLHDVWRAARTP